MAEPERRRRRVRPSTAAARPPAVPADHGPAGEPAEAEPAAGGMPPVGRPTSAAGTGRPTSAAGAGKPSSGAGTGLATSGAGVGRPTSGAGIGGDEREAERGLRGLVGSGSSQVSVSAALRARDAARPTEEQLADADRDLTIVRRNWTPREDLPRSR